MDPVPQFKVRIRATEIASVVATLRDGQRLAETLDHGAVCGYLLLRDQGDHEPSPFLRSECGLYSIRRKLNSLFRSRVQYTYSLRQVSATASGNIGANNVLVITSKGKQQA